jgi:spore coat polysaccharide biosynthesis predicted glycosyltransferase SpsG
MNRDPILIRVDATPRTGYEGLARCLTLAAAIQRRRRPVYFLAQLEPATLALQIKRAGNEWLEAVSPAGSPDDAGETIQEIRRLNPAAVVVDVPDVTQGYLTELRASSRLLVALDNQAAVRMPAHLVINPLLGLGKESYEFDPGTQLLLGQRYALVRPEVRRLRQVRSQEPPPVPTQGSVRNTNQFRALVSLGEDDRHRRTLELAKILLAVPRVARVDVVVRSYHPDLEKLQALAAANPERVEVALEPNEISARIVRAHFAITNGGGWSVELACVGVPQLLIVQNEAHWPTAQRLEEEGCATCLGWHENVSPATIRQAVQNILSDPMERQVLSRCARNLIDGRGPDRLVTALEILLHPSHNLDLSEAA